MSKVRARRNFKDSLFRRIFQEKQELLELYNAVNGSDYKNPEELIITTIEDTLYLGIKNDISFLIDCCLNLYEAQSSWNPNMPLRGLFYFSQIYQGYISEHQLDIYSNTRLQLPAPKYVVFYNGTSKKPDRTELRLSDSYIKPGPGAACLECTATVININCGRNPDLMKNCRKLYEYAYLVDAVRTRLSRGLTLKAAVDSAVTNCIQHGILKSFLLKHRGEVTHMILAEDFRELHMKNEKRLSYSAGVAKGISKGIAKGMSKGMSKGIAKGMSKGISKGVAKGKSKGIAEGKYLSLLQMVCRKLKKGMSAEEIADILEEDTAEITRICRVARQFAPDYDCELIYSELQKQSRSLTVK